MAEPWAWRRALPPTWSECQWVLTTRSTFPACVRADAAVSSAWPTKPVSTRAGWPGSRRVLASGKGRCHHATRPAVPLSVVARARQQGERALRDRGQAVGTVAVRAYVARLWSRSSSSRWRWSWVLRACTAASTKLSRSRAWGRRSRVPRSCRGRCLSPYRRLPAAQQTRTPDCTARADGGQPVAPQCLVTAVGALDHIQAETRCRTWPDAAFRSCCPRRVGSFRAMSEHRAPPAQRWPGWSTSRAAQAVRQRGVGARGSGFSTLPAEKRATFRPIQLSRPIGQ